MIDAPMMPFPMPPMGAPPMNPLMQLPAPDEPFQVLTENGEVVIDNEGVGQEQPPAPQMFGDNLVEHLQADEISGIARDLYDAFERDSKGRDQWLEMVRKGFDLLGLKIEDRSIPWPGACGIVHSMLLEAVVRFQSNAIMEIAPASGPVKTKIVGRVTRDRMAQASRVQEDMNYHLQELMPEWKPETERLLFTLAFLGSAFRKYWFDPVEQRPRSAYIDPRDFYIPYSAATLESAVRCTHEFSMSKTELLRQEAAGFYSRVSELGDPSGILSTDQTREKQDKLTGTTDVPPNEDFRLLEIHALVRIEGDQFKNPKDGIPSPYVITIEKDSQKCIGIRRNWDQNDPAQKRISHFAGYSFVPGFGSYGFGLIHLIGGMTDAATKLLRQLIDAGTLSNVKGGFKDKMARINKNDDGPVMPGVFKDIELTGRSIQDVIKVIDFGEPSGVSAELLQYVVGEARRLGSIADTNLNSQNQEAPVGTTLALIEREYKIINAILQRLHDALKAEFKILARIIRDNEQTYAFEVDAPPESKQQDYDSRIDVIPVSNPNAAILPYRLAQFQQALQLCSQNPQLYDQPELHRGMLLTLGFKPEEVDRFVPDKDKINPADPVTENMFILTGKPVRAFQYQDHDAHLEVHNKFVNDPLITQQVGQSPTFNTVQAAIAAHINEHLAMKYRAQMEQALGIPLPGPDEAMPEDVEYQIAGAMAAASIRVLQENQAKAAQEQQAQQQADPVFQQQQAEQAMRAVKDAADIQVKNQKLALEQAKAIAQDERERERIAAQERIAAAQIQSQGDKNRSDAALAAAELIRDAQQIEQNPGMPQ